MFNSENIYQWGFLKKGSQKLLFTDLTEFIGSSDLFQNFLFVGHKFQVKNLWSWQDAMRSHRFLFCLKLNKLQTSYKSRKCNNLSADQKLNIPVNSLWAYYITMLIGCEYWLLFASNFWYFIADFTLYLMNFSFFFFWLNDLTASIRLTWRRWLCDTYQWRTTFLQLNRRNNIFMEQWIRTEGHGSQLLTYINYLFYFIDSDLVTIFNLFDTTWYVIWSNTLYSS